MKSTLTYILISGSIVLSLPSSACHNTEKDLEDFKRTLTSTPDHIRNLEKSGKYSESSPYTKALEENIDRELYQVQKQKKIVSRKLELEAQKLAHESNEELRDLQQQHDRNMEEIRSATSALKLREATSKEELEKANKDRIVSEERADEIERSKKKIEESRQKSAHIYQGAIKELKKGINEIEEEKVKYKIELEKLKQEHVKSAKEVQNLKEQRDSLMTGISTGINTNSDVSRDTLPASKPNLPISPSQEEFNSDDEIDATLSGN